MASEGFIMQLIPRITSWFSVVGSTSIIARVLSNKKRRADHYHRLMLGMSIVDLLFSFAYAFSSTPALEGTTVGSKGNWGTCNAQGFFIQLGVATPLYNLMLSLYYVLVINFNWKKKQLQKAQYWMHGFPWLFGVATAVAAIPLKLYNPTAVICWIAPSPCIIHEGSEWASNATEEECMRNDNAAAYQWAFFVAWVWFSILVAIINMLTVARAVFKLEKRGAKWKKDNEDAYKRSKQATKQAFMYLLSFLVTWVFLTANLIIAVSGNWAEYGKFPMIVLELLFIPLQGMFNALVYWRPVYMKYLKNRKKSAEELQSGDGTNWSAWSWTASKKHMAWSWASSKMNLSQTGLGRSSSVVKSSVVLESVNEMDEKVDDLCPNEMDEEADPTSRLTSMDTSELTT